MLSWRARKPGSGQRKLPVQARRYFSCADPWGNVFDVGATGYSTATFGSVHSRDSATIAKYDNDGNVVWANGVSNGDAVPLGITADVLVICTCLGHTPHPRLCWEQPHLPTRRVRQI
jgi:hypothetical protein